MNTNIIEKRQTYTVYADLQVPGNPGVGYTGFKRTILLDFMPDEVHVKYITYFNQGTDVSVDYIYCDLIGDIIGPIIEGSQTINTTFPMKKNVNSIYTFTIFSMDGQPTQYRTGDLVIGLEFVKYRDAKQEKIY